MTWHYLYDVYVVILLVIFAVLIGVVLLWTALALSGYGDRHGRPSR